MIVTHRRSGRDRERADNCAGYAPPSPAFSQVSTALRRCELVSGRSSVDSDTRLHTASDLGFPPHPPRAPVAQRSVDARTQPRPEDIRSYTASADAFADFAVGRGLDPLSRRARGAATWGAAAGLAALANLGTCMGDQRFRQLATDAGFGDVRTIPTDNPFFVLYELTASSAAVGRPSPDRRSTPMRSEAHMDTTDLEGVEAALGAVHRLQPSLNAFTHVLADEAVRRAAVLDAAFASGPLHGVPMAVKDQIDVAGRPCTGGCAAYGERIADRDAPVVGSLREAGAVVVAKTNMHELGTGATGLISCFGPTRNPWDPDRMPEDRRRGRPQRLPPGPYRSPSAATRAAPSASPRRSTA